jgi:hypothetical protein
LRGINVFRFRTESRAAARQQSPDLALDIPPHRFASRSP